MVYEVLDDAAYGFESFENGNNYFGQNDEMIDFLGNTRSFADLFSPVIDSSNAFVVSIGIGTNFAKRGVQLFGNLLVGAEESDYSFLSGTLDTGLTVSATPKKYERLLAFLQQNPSVLKGMQIECSNPAVTNSVIVTKEVSPFRDLKTDNIILSSFVNGYMQNVNIVTVPNLNKVVSEQTYWLLNAPAAATAYTINVTFYFAASINLSATLEKKLQRAGRNVSSVGGASVAQAKVLAQPTVASVQVAQPLNLSADINKQVAQVAAANNVSPSLARRALLASGVQVK